MDPHGGKLWRKQRRTKGIGEAEDYVAENDIGVGDVEAMRRVVEWVLV